MKISRRDFVKTGFTSLLGGFVVWGNLPALLRDLISPDAGQGVRLNKSGVDEKHYWRFIVDITKCIGCGKCVKACKLENDVPLEPEYSRTWVERYVITETEEVFVDSPNAGIDGFTAEYVNMKYEDLSVRKSFFVPKLCQQ